MQSFLFLAALGLFKKVSWQELLFPLACGMFLFALLWYLTVRVCLDVAGRAWRDKLAKETAHRHAAETANRVKAEFLTNMSHEIRTPLNAIINCTELTMRTPLTPELRHYLGTMRSSADWLIHIVNDVLEFSRIEAGTLRLDNAAFSLKECIKTALDIAGPEAESRHLVLKYKVDPCVPTDLRGDFSRLLQVLFNLVENAVKNTPTGGVVVAVDRIKEEGRTIQLRFSVADTGVGLTEDKVKELFNPLSQKSAEGVLGDDRQWKTSAFGLAICKRVIELMGGAIDVQSHVGAGTTVTFTAEFETLVEARTVSARRTATVQPAPAPACSAARRIYILLFDENELSRRLARTLLESAGHFVEEAEQRREILPWLARKPFDLVLIDLDLATDDLELTRAIRAAETAPARTPIYTLTAAATPADRERGRGAGIDGFIAKPMEIDDVLNVIAAIALRPVPGQPTVPATARRRKDAYPAREPSDFSLPSLETIESLWNAQR